MSISEASVPVETFRFSMTLPEAVDSDLFAREVLDRLRLDVARRDLIVVSDPTVEIVPELIPTNTRTIVASVRVLVDPPPEVREHLRDRQLRLEPSVSRVSFPLIDLATRVVVDGRRETVPTETDHGSHDRLIPTCEQCQALVFAATAARARST